MPQKLSKLNPSYPDDLVQAVERINQLIPPYPGDKPLATADYTDTIPDSQLGEELESTDWDLPPDDLRYILALPNGIMCGFFANQLCFSAQGRPHAPCAQPPVARARRPRRCSSAWSRATSGLPVVSSLSP